MFIHPLQGNSLGTYLSFFFIHPLQGNSLGTYLSFFFIHPLQGNSLGTYLSSFFIHPLQGNSLGTYPKFFLHPPFARKFTRYLPKLFSSSTSFNQSHPLLCKEIHLVLRFSLSSLLFQSITPFVRKFTTYYYSSCSGVMYSYY